MPGGPLDHLSVFDLSTGIAGGYAGRLLADAGAAVTKIEWGNGDPLRWCTAGDFSPNGGALFRFLHQEKNLVRCDDLGQIGDRLDRADILLIGPDLTVAGLPRTPLSATQVLVVITPFGLSGPYAGRPSSELVLQAESGSLATRGHDDEPPLMAGGRTTEWITGAYGAAAAVAAVRSGRNEIVDLSMLEVAHVAGTAYGPLQHRLAGSPCLAGPIRQIETVEIHPTVDGWVGFTTNSAEQFQSFLLLIDRADLLDDSELALARGRLARRVEWASIVNAWTSTRTTAAIITMASDLRIPCAPVLDAASVLEFPFFAERQVLQRSTGGDFVHPRTPWLLDGHAPTATTTTPVASVATPSKHLPLDGIRVVDMTAWWAGPTATHLLAALGADVIHVESTARPDGMRMQGGIFKDQSRWWERSPFFLSVNTNKRGISLDLRQSDGMVALERLIATADVLVENFTPRVLENMGLSWERLRSINERLILVRMPAFGLSGTWRDRPGFAQTMEQLSGLAWITGWRGGQPHNQRGPCDPNGGIHSAFATLCALEARARDGRGHHLEVPFVEVALNAAAEAIVECSQNGAVLSREGNRMRMAAPQNVYRCAGDEQWLALSVETDEQWCGLREAMGRPAWAESPEFTTHSGRRAHHDDLDSRLGMWASQRSAAEAVELLIRHGVPAGEVRDPRLAGEHPQLGARHFYEELDHPVVGAQSFASLPFRFASVTKWLQSPAPTLGQHTVAVLTELGYTLAEIADLDRDGVIGTEPLGLQ